MKEMISVIGLGRLGLPFLLSFASEGYKVVGVDIDENKISKLHSKNTYLFEPEVIESVKKYEHNITVTTDYKLAITTTSITFIAVQTPSKTDGSFSLKYILQACREIGKILKTKKSKHTIVITSTVSPVSMKVIQRELEKYSNKKVGIDIGLCYSPEFIALGQVIEDVKNPDFILIGESDKETGNIITRVRKSICKNNPKVLRTNFINAEIAKLSLNTYLTTKMSFANMIARMCEQIPGADAQTVSDIIGTDERVGKKYLVGSVAYGGPCFPRDNRALSEYLDRIGLSISLPEVIDDFNKEQNNYLFDLIVKYAKKNDVIGILGLTYKPDTDIVEESPGKIVAQKLLKKEYKVITYDPAYKKGFQNDSKKLHVVSTIEEVIEKSSVVVIATPWKEFQSIPVDSWKNCKFVIDCWRILKTIPTEPIRYIPFGIYIEK
jgi:UDPglucose 6-dehydrogenase